MRQQYREDTTKVGIGARTVLVTVLVAVVLCVVTFKVLSLDNLRDEPVWAVYGLVITGFIFMRFLLGWCYRPRRRVAGYRPTVAIIVPAYNEPDIAKTLAACLSVDYPKELIRVVVVDDKSTDDTLRRIYAVAEAYPELTVIPAPVNQGKRHAMATGIATADDVEVYVFIDSDSQVMPDAVKHHRRVLRRPESRCGGRSYRRRQRRAQRAHPYAGKAVLHRLPHLQERRATVGSVMCCSGCFSAYGAMLWPGTGCLAGPDASSANPPRSVTTAR